jgi:glycosyltransferase involved in cell wall biosynthesis
MHRPDIALCVIARDEAPRIARLLDSARPWVDAMLVLDTGSADGTAEVARRCGARVEHFIWCDDFSAARNVSLDLVPARWHLVLDADEWLVDGAAALQALRHEPATFAGALQRTELAGADGGAVVRNWITRILPGDVRYRGRVHEQPVHGLPVRRLPLQVRHDGYTAGRHVAKQGRNRRLLEAELEEQPRDAYLWYQLGVDHAAYDEHESAARAFMNASALGADAAPWRYDLAARLLFALKKCHRHEEGLDFAQARLEALADSPDFFFALGDLLLDAAAEMPARAGELLPMARAAWTRCLEIGERPDLTGSVEGRGSHLAAHNLAVIAAFAGADATPA